MFALLEPAHFALYFMFSIRGQMFGWSLLSMSFNMCQFIYLKKTHRKQLKKEAWSNLDIVIMLFVWPTVTCFSEARINLTKLLILFCHSSLNWFPWLMFCIKLLMSALLAHLTSCLPNFPRLLSIINPSLSSVYIFDYFSQCLHYP